jgi:hypothetical protein
MTVSLVGSSELYRRRGLGAWFTRGCTGTTYGEIGRDKFARLSLLLIAWELHLQFHWKGA